MLLARVEGHVVAVRKHPSLEGWRLVVCQPIGADGRPEGTPQVAIDALGAGMHQQVVISSDGAAARRSVGDEKSPVRWLIIGIVDEKAPGERV
ncbi:EutN/CcmL family microcompartment protein [Limisphaera ngatamarikiensis]|uniref:EutN/CcmL family microcompartment protein n=1 Tax=Limisphaera ngatamarikiensis TaxID=1324935 RepID=A0A6M1RSA8_9BACT|nr:EutN/CcmL family microcompartment protein [Limisphaera ngatamarikiensis]NGO38364.1 EutN/CcmL family microcompartment protein [Limisphaera ngatamarikiensis]